MTTTKFETTNVTVNMTVVEDCVIFEARCLCHCIEQNITDMAQKAHQLGKNNVVLIGDCGDHEYTHDERFLKATAGSDLKWVWLDRNEEYKGRGRVKLIIPGFNLMEQIRSFSDAEMFVLTLNHLISAASNHQEVLAKIETEKKLIAEYPVICSVEGLEYHPCTMRNEKLCPLKLGEGAWDLGLRPQQDIKADANMVACFTADLSKGVLVTKSLQIKFTIDEEYTKDLSLKSLESGYSFKHGGGSLRIMLERANQHLSLYTKRVAAVRDHPELNPRFSSPHFEPMWQRLQGK